MAYSNGIITAPVSIDDVKQALGVGSNDLGTLCKSPQINMWARNKPVVYPAPFSFNYGAGLDGKFGIQPFTFTDLSTINTRYVDGNKNGWVYTPPTGGATAPYRLGDFNGYKSDSVPPFYNINVAGGCKDLSDYLTITGDIRNALEDDEIAVSEIDGVSDRYFGVAVTNTSNVAKGCITSTGTITATGINLQFNISTLSEGNYIVYPFLAAAAINPQSAGNSHTGTFYTIPKFNPITVSVYNAYAISDYKGVKNSLDGSITGSVIIINKTGSAIDFGTIVFRLRYQGKTFNETMLPEEQNQTVSGATTIVPANSSKTISTRTFTDIPFELLNNCQLYMRITFYGNNKIYSTIPEYPPYQG